MNNQMLMAGIIFIVAYLLIIIRPFKPVYTAFGAAAVLLLTGTIDVSGALASININVLGIVWGMMIIAELFIASHATDYLAGRLVSRMRTVGLALVAVSIFAGLISAVVDNVATVLIIAPVAFEIANRLKVSPVPFLIGVAVSSNLQGMATMIGDSTSIILAANANMNFLNFFFMEGKPSIFWAVELGAVISALVLWFMFRHMSQKVEFESNVEVKSWVPSWLLLLLIFTLAASSVIPNKPDYFNGLVTVLFAFIGLAWNSAKGKLPFSFAGLDWETLAFLIGIFVLVGSLSSTGVVSWLASVITQFTGGSKLTAFLVLVWISVVISAFVDNIPYTIAMLPVANQVAASLGVSPLLLMFGLTIGTSLGGNITPIGASANVVAVGMLRKRGHDVSFGEFMKIGLPFTLAAVISASAFIWFIWA